MAFGTITERIRLLFDDDASEGIDQVGEKFGGMAATLKKAATIGGLAIAANKLFDLGQATLKLAVDADEAAAAFDTTFGPATSRVGRFVDDFANKAGFASGELQQLLAVTGNVAQGIGFTEEASADLSIEMATLAGDVASFSNAAGGAPAVLQALQSALNGEREALKTYGLAVSEAEVVTAALAATGKKSADDLSRQEKALATLEIATSKAGKAIGDLDRTQDSTANSMRRLQARLKEGGTEIGRALIPAIDKLIPALENALPDIIDATVTLANAFTAIADPAAKLLGYIDDLGRGGTLLKNSFLNVGQGILSAVPFVGALTDALGMNHAEAIRTRQAQSDLAIVIQAVTEGSIASEDAALNMANGLAELGRRGSLTGFTIDELTEATGANADETRRAILAVLDAADANGIGEDAAKDLRIAAGELAVEAGHVTDEWSETERMMARYGQTTEEATDATEEMSPAMKELRDRMAENERQAFETGKAMREDLAGAIADSIDIIDGAVEEISISLETLEENIAESFDQQTEFYGNLALLAAAGYDDLAAGLESRGPEMAGVAADLVNDLERASDLEDVIEQGKRQSAEAADAYITGLNSRSATVLARFEAFGIDMARAIAAGFSSIDLGRRTLDSLVDSAPGALTPTAPTAPPPGSGITPNEDGGAFINGRLAFALGGTVPGGPGDEIPATLHGSEIVIPPTGSSAQQSFVAELSAALARNMPQGGSGGAQELKVTIEVDQNGQVTGVRTEAQSENLATTIERLVRL